MGYVDISRVVLFDPITLLPHLLLWTSQLVLSSIIPSNSTLVNHIASFKTATVSCRNDGLLHHRVFDLGFQVC